MMAQKVKNPLAQALGLVLQGTRDKMGGISSTEIASRLGLAASHYRMIEAGSAILQPSRAVKIVQTFDTIEFVPLCQLLVAIQILDSAKQSIKDMRTTAGLLTEANPALANVLKGFDGLWEIIDTAEPGDVAKQITSLGIAKELESFLTTEPVIFTADQIDNFMTPTYQYPISGQLYNKIGNILQGVAPFYLDTVLQLIDNLKNITPRVTPEELANWESSHKNRISHIIGIVRKPEIILDVNTFDYTFLWQENFQKMMIIHRNKPEIETGSIHQRIADCLRTRFESERVKYERELNSLDEIVNEKLTIGFGKDNTDKIDQVLLYRDVAMNNLWFYIMTSGYVVPFIDNAAAGSTAADLYGTSLAYDETCEKLVDIKELCSEIGFEL
ncbi:MAG: helix-turn-helix domain-containing protein [Planctomycetota bacterium]|jgi:hypothetical protein